MSEFRPRSMVVPIAVKPSVGFPCFPWVSLVGNPIGHSEHLFNINLSINDSLRYAAENLYTPFSGPTGQLCHGDPMAAPFNAAFIERPIFPFSFQTALTENNRYFDEKSNKFLIDSILGSLNETCKLCSLSTGQLESSVNDDDVMATNRRNRRVILNHSQNEFAPKSLNKACAQCNKEKISGRNENVRKRNALSPLQFLNHCNHRFRPYHRHVNNLLTNGQQQNGCLCLICGKSFSRHWLLQGHMRTHTGEKPFRCHVCSKAFADKSNLRAHIQTHSGVKPFVCLRCGKSFALKSYLSKHTESACVKLTSLETTIVQRQGSN